VYESALGLTETLARVPVHVIPCLDSRFDGTDQLIAASAWASIIPAGWSFLLALRSRTIEGVVEFSRCRGLFRPLPAGRRTRRVVLQFLACTRVAPGRVCLTGKQDETWLAVAEIRADHHKRLEAHVVDPARK
jgi:hypothetical protein